MSVALRRQRDGKLRPYFYGEYRDRNGKRKVENLGEWRGTPPPALLGTGTADTGDAAFEASRKDAEDKLRAHADDAQRKGRADHLIERLIESKTGHAVEHVRIAEIAERWLSMPRGGELSGPHAAGIRATGERFKTFMARRNPEAAFLYEVTTTDAGKFAESMRKEFAPRTARGYTVLLRSAFRRFLPSGVANPFAGIVASRNGDTASDDMMHRKPFTPEELRAILDTVRGDPFMHPLIVTAACTGMRRGDVCGLRWSAVDLAGGMLDVKTAKTGGNVEIPIFPPLREVLEARGSTGKGYVFPEAAAMYRNNAGGLSYRFKAIVAKALDIAPSPAPTESVPVAEIEAEAAAAIVARVPEGARRDRMIDILRRYAAGETARQIERATGRARGTISTDLHAVQDWIGKTFLRPTFGKHTRGETWSVRGAIRRVTREHRERGQKSASVRDWHALRTTWVTLALAAGVPMELVRRVTGHTTVDIVLRHYFRPGREDFRAALAGALPDVLTGGKSAKMKPADELAALAGKVAAGSATEEDKARLRKLAAKV